MRVVEGAVGVYRLTVLRCKWERVSGLDGVNVRGDFDSLPSLTVDERCTLAPKAFEALLMLVGNPGHLVDKDDLNEAALARYLSWRRQRCRALLLIEKNIGRGVGEGGGRGRDWLPPQAIPGANLTGKKVSPIACWR